MYYVGSKESILKDGSKSNISNAANRPGEMRSIIIDH